MTRLDDLLDFGQLFEAFGNNYFAQILGSFCVKIFNLSSEIIFRQLLWTFGNFFTGHTGFLLNGEPGMPKPIPSCTPQREPFIILEIANI